MPWYEPPSAPFSLIKRNSASSPISLHFFIGLLLALKPLSLSTTAYTGTGMQPSLAPSPHLLCQHPCLAWQHRTGLLLLPTSTLILVFRPLLACILTWPSRSTHSPYLLAVSSLVHTSSYLLHLPISPLSPSLPD